MDIEKINDELRKELSRREYYKMYEIINDSTEKYLSAYSSNTDLCVKLIEHNQDLFEYMGASKQFEMAFDLQNRLKTNRNRLFLSCLSDELKPLFKRAVGDFSTE